MHAEERVEGRGKETTKGKSGKYTVACSKRISAGAIMSTIYFSSIVRSRNLIILRETHYLVQDCNRTRLLY